jgi:hypothetical protein
MLPLDPLGSSQPSRRLRLRSFLRTSIDGSFLVTIFLVSFKPRPAKVCRYSRGTHHVAR